MDIIREKPSRNGILATQIFQNISQIRKIDNYRTNKWGRKSVLQITYEGSKVFPIMFPCTDLRDAALAKIECATSVVVLDFNEYFTRVLLSDEKAQEYVPFKLLGHLKKCIDHILTKEKVTVADLRIRDAFKVFTSADLQSIREDAFEIKSAQLCGDVWSKTLNVPRSILDMGVTPLQFFKGLIKNEERITNTRNYADSV
jgi:hypothetical protein